jgi:DNA-directed RNA polymerase subunit F
MRVVMFMTANNTNLISESPISMSELKTELAKIKKRDSELNFRAQKTEEYLEQFELLGKKDTEEMMKKLAALEIPRLKTEHIIKIADTMPNNPEEVKSVLQGTTVTVSKENLKRIADVVAEFKK